MRRAAKIDANQKEVVDAMRAIGATVHSLAALGDGCPDLLVGYNGRTVLMEVKDGNKPQWEIKLTPAQEKWHKSWTGSTLAIVYGPEGAIKLLRSLA